MVIKPPEAKSSFLSIEKDMHLITNMLLRNQRLQKLLYYTTPDCLSRPDLTEDQSLELFGKNIKLIPRIKADDNELNYLIIKFHSFVPNETNPEFRDNLIEFDILCHLDIWQLKDFQLRPYKIAAELDSMFNNKHLSGIGELKFLGASQRILDNDYGLVCLSYDAIHGEEDKKDMLNPKDEKQFQEDFKKLMGLDD